MIDVFASIPAGVWLFFTVLVLVVGAVIFYALHHKGDVLAELSHGTTSLGCKLEISHKRKDAIKNIL